MGAELALVLPIPENQVPRPRRGTYKKIPARGGEFFTLLFINCPVLVMGFVALGLYAISIH